jgi:RNA polymerase sigma factor (sigma-70 family)
MAETPRPNPLLHRLRAWAATEALGKLTDRELLRRYAQTRDDQAFQVVMERHGSMVLRACRRFLGNQQDAEDAFQATFFVLARKAGVRRWEQSVANWLYSVACCVSRTARRASARRKSHEQRSPSKEAGTPQEELSAREFMAVFDEELTHLPDKYRAVLVQVYLEGKSQDEAARALGVSLDAVRKRLERGRGLLEARMTRRGLSLSIALTAILVSEKAATAVVPAALAAGTLWAVRLYETGQAAVGATSTAHALAVAALHRMIVEYVRPLVRVAVVLLLVGGTAGLTVALVGRPAAEPLAQETPSSSKPTPPRPTGPKAAPALDDPLPPMLPVAGRVLDAAGRAVPFAAVTALVRRPFRPGEHGLRDEVVARGHADEKGAFRLRVPADFPTWFPERQVVLVAKASGHAPFTTLVRLAEQGATEVDLRLTAAPRVVRGRLLAPDGAAAPGVRLRIVRLGDVARETVQGTTKRAGHDLGWPGPMVSDAQGRFTLSGVDPEQGVWLQVEDDRYAPDAFALRGADKPTEVRLKPARVLEGRVLAADTGKAVAGVKLTTQLASQDLMRSRFTVPDYLSVSARALPPISLDSVTGTDGRFRLRPPAGSPAHGTEEFRPKRGDDGHYRLQPLAMSKTVVEVHPPADSPYLAVCKEVDWSEGVVRQTLAVALPRGVVVRGQVVDEDGRPVVSASVQFISPPYGNPAYRPDVLQAYYRIVRTGEGGRFRLTAPSGPVQLQVHGPTHEYRTQALRWWSRSVRKNKEEPERWGWGAPLFKRQFYAHAQQELRLAEDPTEVRLRLVRGETVAGRVVGPDGEPVETAVLLCGEKVSPLRNGTALPLPVHEGHYELPGCTPGRVYPVLFLDAVNGWGAAVDLTVGRGAGPEVKLARCGSARLRLRDGKGRPLAGCGPRLVLATEQSFPEDKPPRQRVAEGHRSSSCGYDPLHYATDPVSDKEGWLTLPALIPGARYVLGYVDVEGVVRHTREFRVEPGEQLQLPDLAIRDRE